MDLRKYFLSIHDSIEAFRKAVEDSGWNKPNLIDSLRFSLSESVEALDEEMRTRGGFARNTEKEPDRRRANGEYADTVMMCLTAMSCDRNPLHWWDFPTEGDFEGLGDLAGDMSDRIAIEVAEALRTYLSHGERWSMYIQDAIAMCYIVSKHHGFDLGELIAEKLTKTAHKHCGGDVAMKEKTGMTVDEFINSLDWGGQQ